MLDHESSEITPGGTKKTAKLNIEKQSDSGRRLVEYFVVVSSVEWHDKDSKDAKDASKDTSFSEWKTESSFEDEEEFAGYHFRPAITARYPRCDHQDNPLHENVTFFCHPSGGIQIRTQEEMPKVSWFGRRAPRSSNRCVSHSFHSFFASRHTTL